MSIHFEFSERSHGGAGVKRSQSGFPSCPIRPIPQQPVPHAPITWEELLGQR